MSRKTARQREETPVCAMCLEPYAVPSPGETIFSCTACSAVLHGECYKRFKDADRQRAQARYEAECTNLFKASCAGSFAAANRNRDLEEEGPPALSMRHCVF